MNPTKTTYCGRCRALRWVENWSERGDEMLSIVLGPCGHAIERTARLEWMIPSGRIAEHSGPRFVHGGRLEAPVGRTRDRVATS